MAKLAAILALANLLGALPTGLLVTRLLGTADLRDHGSRSTGATNVLRVQGWPAALVVAALDLAKGWIAVAALPRIVLGDLTGTATWLLPAAGLAAVLGHVWPVLARFRGGKGAATAAGAVLAFTPAAFAASMVVFTALVAGTRRVSVGSLGAAVCAPWLLYLFARTHRAEALAFGLALLALVAFAHRANVANLIAGTEPRIGSWRVKRRD